MTSRHLGRAAHAAGLGSRLRDNPNNHLIGPAAVLVCPLILAVGVFLVMQPFLSALLWGTLLTISAWPMRVLGGRMRASAAILTLAACAVLLIPLALLGHNLAEIMVQLIVGL